LTWLGNRAHRETAFGRAHRDSAIYWLDKCLGDGTGPLDLGSMVG